MNGAQLGLIIPVGFGCLWAVAGTTDFRGASRFLILLASIGISGALIFATLRTPLQVRGQFDGSIFAMAVAFEALAIAAVVIILNRRDWTSLILPAIAIIVGLHFVGLWRATANVSFIWLALALCVVGLVAASLPAPMRRPVAGLGSALSLWGTAALTLFLS